MEEIRQGGTVIVKKTEEDFKKLGDLSLDRLDRRIIQLEKQFNAFYLIMKTLEERVKQLEKYDKKGK